MSTLSRVLSLADLPVVMQAEVERYTAEISQIHGVVTSGYSFIRSYDDGTPRLLLFVQGTFNGRVTHQQFMAGEFYAGDFIFHKTFDVLWESAT